MSPLGSAAATFLISAVGTLVVGRLVIPALVRAQRVASPGRYEDCPPLLAYQETKRGTPTMGGLFVLLVGMGVAALAGGLTHREGWLVIGAATGLGAIGLTDDGLKFRSPDSRGLGVLPKLLMALAIGAVVGLATEPGYPARSAKQSEAAGSAKAGHPRVRHSASTPMVDAPEVPNGESRRPTEPVPSIPRWAWVVFAMVVVAGCAHAVNLTDGMDGLAAGCVAIALGVIGLWVILHEPADRTVIIWCASLAGACAGFLWFNSFPASIFLGDVGSLGLGAALGTISLVTHRALWLVVIGGVFVAEALSVILQVASYKWRNKQRIFRVAPLHHHVHLGGVSEPKVTVRFWIVAMLLAMLALTVMELT